MSRVFKPVFVIITLKRDYKELRSDFFIVPAGHWHFILMVHWDHKTLCHRISLREYLLCIYCTCVCYILYVCNVLPNWKGLWGAMVLIRSQGSNEQRDRQWKLNKCLLTVSLLMFQGAIPYAFTRLPSVAAHRNTNIRSVRHPAKAVEVNTGHWTNSGLVFPFGFLVENKNAY